MRRSHREAEGARGTSAPKSPQVAPGPNETTWSSLTSCVLFTCVA